MIRFNGWMVAALALAIATTAITAPTSAADKVVIAQPSEGFLYLPVYVARAKGYFKDEGIELDVQVFNGGAPAMAAVISGDVHIYTGLPSTTIKAFAKSQPVIIWAAMMDQVGSNFVIQGDVAKRLNLTDKTPIEDRLKALKGLTIGINGPGSSLDQLIRYFVRNAGMNPDKDLTITPLGAEGAAMVAAFGQKRVDGFLFSSPTSDLAMKRHGGHMLINLAKGEYPPLDKFLYVTFNSREDWLAKNPEVATRVARALWKGEKLMRDNPAEAASAVRTFFPKMDQETFDLAWEGTRSAVPATPVLTRKQIEQALKFLADTEGSVPVIDIDKVFTTAYVDAAGKGMVK